MNDFTRLVQQLPESAVKASSWFSEFNNERKAGWRKQWKLPQIFVSSWFSEVNNERQAEGGSVAAAPTVYLEKQINFTFDMQQNKARKQRSLNIQNTPAYLFWKCNRNTEQLSSSIIHFFLFLFLYTPTPFTPFISVLVWLVELLFKGTVPLTSHSFDHKLIMTCRTTDSDIVCVSVCVCVS